MSSTDAPQGAGSDTPPSSAAAGDGDNAQATASDAPSPETTPAEPGDSTPAEYAEQPTEPIETEAEVLEPETEVLEPDEIVPGLAEGVPQLPAEDPATATELFPPSTLTVPAEAEPSGERDRLAVHFVWEGVLLILVALGVAAWFLFGHTAVFSDLDSAASTLVGVAPFMLLAMALGLSLRVGAVNLAAPFLAFLTAMLYGHLDKVAAVDLAYLAAIMVGAGLVLTLLVTVLRVPGWAAGLGMGAAAWGAMDYMRDTGFGDGFTQPTHLSLSPFAAWVTVGVVVLVSIAGGVVGLIPALRRVCGDSRDAAAGVKPRGVASFLLTAAALIGSCLLAGVAGVLSKTDTGANFNSGVLGATLGFSPLLAALGIVLIGGTGLRGRRGGVFGTLLAAVVAFAVTVVVPHDLLGAGSVTDNFLIPVGLFTLGLLVNLGFDLFNRPKKTPAAAPAHAAEAEAAPTEVEVNAYMYRPAE
ncbi:MAG TPA: hypothetical protein VE172_19205 [Stackebrandtia sp.]|jgi:ribose/xylose/arabinose/galactoside ABC-type transport system permease subunit|uniref:hypothetical protein n=1 Tax=Stackebrandtia sp. TaxID=2023065 RepID=UPI002D6A47C9|nr:hypothetical protein [Stackebrandtia sp.]HZE40932.1 hypothetical protein [Stackebrandtia sp.]